MSDRTIFIIDLGIPGYEKAFVEGHEYNAVDTLQEMLLEVTHDKDIYRSVDNRGWVFEMNKETGTYRYGVPTITGMTVDNIARRNIV